MSYQDNLKPDDKNLLLKLALCSDIYSGVICEAGPELTPAICVKRFTLFIYIGTFLFVKISEVCIYLTGRKENL